MNKYTYIILAAFVALSFTTPARADEATTTATTTRAWKDGAKPLPRPGLLKEKMEKVGEKVEKLGEKVEKRDEKIKEHEEKAADKLKQFVSKRNEQANKIAEKLKEQIINQQELAQKLGKFIEQAKAKGADTTKLSDSLTAAQAKIATAQTKVAAIATLSESTTEITKDKAASVRKSMKDAEVATQESRKALYETAQLIRKAAAKKDFIEMKKSETTPAGTNSQSESENHPSN